MSALRARRIIGRTVRRPIGWILLAAVAAGGAWFAWRGFPQAFSILALDLRMDRAGALAAAESLAVAHRLGPAEDARTAVVFDLDVKAQTYIELEGGGPDAFKQAVARGVFHAYTWRVRRVAPEEINETSIEFTPAGRPLGFRETLSEDAPGPTLPRDSAQSLAEAGAVAGWGVDLAEYVLIDASQQRHPSGRVDHDFSYDAREQPFGDGRLRLRLTVAGDRLTAVSRFLHVPEAFERRYQEIRSANEAIAEVALGAALILYGIGGIGAGLLVMVRRRMVLWRPALAAGLVFGVLQVAVFANSFPFFWLAYETSVQVGAFLLLAVGAALLAGLLTVVQVALSAMAAETLSRAAFPHHPQFWRIWSPEAGASRAVLARTLLGYLLMGVFLGYMVAFWRLTTGASGWWNPTETLVQPNLFATYLPWLGPAALALNAGFWEECLFRAVPLAGAALLGTRFGRRRFWIGAALVLQAVIFSAAHANYPAQPPYARLVELILPSLLFAGVFLRWGLLPAIILHAGYDLALMAIPIFAARSPGIWIDRTMVVAVALAPLGIVIWRRVRAGRWVELPDSLRNRGWVPPPPAPSRPAHAATKPAALTGRWLIPLGGVGFIAWAGLADWSGPLIRLDVPRERAVTLARTAVEQRAGPLDLSWRTLAGARSAGGFGFDDQGHRFIWETAGDSVYRALLGDALAGPHWRVRFARFEGDVAERAEEWAAGVAPGGRVERVDHRIPESRPGARLDEAAARALADSVLRLWAEEHGGAFELVAIRSDQRPARADWSVTYADTSIGLPVGEVRVRIVLRGDEARDPERFVFVPESWSRQWMRTLLLRGIPTLLFGGGMFVLFGVVLVASVIRAARGQADWRVALVLLGGLAGLGLLGLASAWPERVAEFTTSRPWGVQAGLAAARGVVGAILLPMLIVSIVAAWLTRRVVDKASDRGSWIAAGFLLAGAGALVSSLGGGPPGLDPGPVGHRWPQVTVLAQVPAGFITRLSFLLVPFWVGDRLARGGRSLEQAWYLVAGGAMALAFSPDLDPLDQALAFAAGAAVFAILVRVVRSAGIGVLVWAGLLWTGLQGLPGAWGRGPGTLLGWALGVAVAVALARLAWRSRAEGHAA